VSAVALDHLILPVNDLGASRAFYVETLGFAYAGERPPFTVVRVNESTTLQLAPWGTEGNQHLAFAMPRTEFEAAFARICAAGIAYGDSFHAASNMCGPGEEDGARGPGKALYLLDPNRHLIELRYYE
jgi:catechol 2,3-dioxygenase-like lactoylglutathione lyase family enzyme